MSATRPPSQDRPSRCLPLATGEAWEAAAVLLQDARCEDVASNVFGINFALDAFFYI